MKRSVRSIVCALLFPAVWAALIAFSGWGFDPSAWQQESRFFFGLVAIILGAIGYMFGSIEWDF